MKCTLYHSTCNSAICRSNPCVPLFIMFTHSKINPETQINPKAAKPKTTDPNTLALYLSRSQERHKLSGERSREPHHSVASSFNISISEKHRKVYLSRFLRFKIYILHIETIVGNRILSCIVLLFSDLYN